MAYTQLTLRMIRVLASLNKKAHLSRTTPDSPAYLITGGTLREIHWATVRALCRREMLSPVRTGERINYELTDQARLYLAERSDQHHQDHA